MTNIKSENFENIFVAANPLQILISTSLIRQLNVANKSTLIIHGGFTGAKEVFYRFDTESIKISGAKVIYLETRKDVFKWVKKASPLNLFVDGDVGIRNFISLLFLKICNLGLTICIFEEGIGTYRRDLYGSFKKILFPMFGVGTNFGGSVLTSYVYATDPDKYKAIFPRLSRRVRAIAEGPGKVLLGSQKAWGEIFDYQEITDRFSNKCNVYLTNWNLDHDAVKRMMDHSGDNYLKLHPRCLDQAEVPGVVMLKATAPAELIIADLSRKYTEVNVYHHGSSVEQYFSKANVNFIRL